VIIAAPAIPVAIRTQVTLTQQGWKEPDAGAALVAAWEIAKIYGDAAILKTGPEATEAAGRALVETADVVHVSAPLQMSGPTPLFSSLLLAGAAPDRNDKEKGLGNDGRWEAREWFGINGRARVMVISDASSFGASGVGGSMDALAWAAAAGGVPSLLIGRWPADGFSSDTVIGAFHAQLAKGIAAIDAWRLAVAATRETSGAAPAGWAGLRLIGGP
jgi:hypothetical protein